MAALACGNGGIVMDQLPQHGTGAPFCTYCSWRELHPPRRGDGLSAWIARSASISLDGFPHLRVSLKAQVQADEDKGTPGSVGLELQTTRTVCSADDPEQLKAEIKTSSEAVTKAMKELESAKPNERPGKFLDTVDAIGDMYYAIDKAKKGCRQVPSATFNFGLQGPLGNVPADKINFDPTMRPSPSMGADMKFYF